MSFGIGYYGTSQYGVGVGAPPSTTIDLLVQPPSATIGSRAYVNSYGTNISNSILDDNLTSSLSSKWLVSVTGDSAYTTTSAGTIATAANGKFEITTKTKLSSANVSVNYCVTSDVSYISSVGPVILAGMSYVIDSNNYIKVERSIMGATSYVVSTLCVNGLVLYSVAQDASIRGTLRISYHNGSFVTYHNSTRIMSGVITANLGNILIYNDAQTSGASIITKFNGFTSSVGFMFGTSIVDVIELANVDTYVMYVPQYQGSGIVDVLAFNHTGRVAIGNRAFTYPLVRGTRLTVMQGMDADLLGDPVLR